VQVALLQVCKMKANDPERPGRERIYQGALTKICEADVKEKARLGVPGFEKWNDWLYNRQIGAIDDEINKLDLRPIRCARRG
jgi:hypothetical protein